MITIIIHAIKYQNIFTIRHTHALSHTFTQSQSSFLSYCCQLELQCDQAHTQKLAMDEEKNYQKEWANKSSHRTTFCCRFVSTSQLSLIHLQAYTHALTYRALDKTHLPLLIKRNRSNPRSCEHLARSTCNSRSGTCILCHNGYV